MGLYHVAKAVAFLNNDCNLVRPPVALHACPAEMRYAGLQLTPSLFLSLKSLFLSA